MTTTAQHTVSRVRFDTGADFLLYNETAKSLYHDAARPLPVIDPHNHVDAAALAANQRFENLYQLWIKPDAYKHRLMRNLGVSETLITGGATDYEKFMAWTECLQHTVGNPVFHWSCMELRNLFGITDLPTVDNAANIWEKTCGLLQQEGFGALDIVKNFGVELLCTSDDLLDSLEHHLALQEQQKGLQCLPSLRGDSIIAFQTPQFGTWLQKLQHQTGIAVNDLHTYQAAIIKRIDFFEAAGCLLSDHSLDNGFIFNPATEQKAAPLFAKVLQQEGLSSNEAIQLQSCLLHFLGTEYAHRNWKLQLHIGAQRYTSTRLRGIAGPFGGFACIGNAADVSSLCLLLDGLEQKAALPKTILYNLNPADNAAMATLAGSFTEEGVRGKIQFGPAWWFNDHYEGITAQLTTLAHYGLLSTSIGMTTDSRSILSFLRHDYYRRILCNLLGDWAEKGRIPGDWHFLSGLVSNIAYHNCKNWIKK